MCEVMPHICLKFHFISDIIRELLEEKPVNTRGCSDSHPTLSCREHSKCFALRPEGEETIQIYLWSRLLSVF